MITMAWAVQEEVFIVLNPSLTKAHRTRAPKLTTKEPVKQICLCHLAFSFLSLLMDPFLIWY